MGKYILSFLLFLGTFAQANTLKLEAEEATLHGVQVATAISGYSGSGYVTGFDSDGDKVVFTLDWEEAGKFQLYIGYAATSGNKNNVVKVNGDNIGDLLFPETKSFKEIDAGKITLKAGENSVSIEKSWGWFEVDYIKIGPTTESVSWNIPTTTVNPNASDETKSLLKYLVHSFGKTTFAGQYQNNDNYTSNSSDITFIKNTTNKYPALYGNDLINYSPSRVEHGAKSNAVEDVIDWHQNAKGMVTLSWHWNAPTDLYNTDDNPWWSGFYTRATSFNIKEVLANPDSEKYQLILRDIDAIASELKKLEALHIPILWRPLHEAEGAWFWWGAQGPEPCVELWQLLYNRLTNHHQINNLLWVWTTTDSPQAMDWYPGDEFVDILGVDVYLDNGDYGVSSTMFDNLRNMFQGQKLLAMSENGTIPDPDKLFSQEAYWSYFCTWSGDFIRDGKRNTENHIDEVYNHKNITTLDEMDEDWIKFTSNTNHYYNSNFDFHLSPNPFQAEIKLNFTHASPKRIRLVSPSGNTIYSTDYKHISTINKLSFESLPSGIYFIQAEFSSNIITKRVVKL